MDVFLVWIDEKTVPTRDGSAIESISFLQAVGRILKFHTHENMEYKRTDMAVNRHQALLPPPVRPLQVRAGVMAQAQGYRQPCPQTLQGQHPHAFRTFKFPRPCRIRFDHLDETNLESRCGLRLTNWHTDISGLDRLR